ncbi:tail fiber assembly protein [Kosakonia quasisacchari]|uniref:Tail fiber assembly protein n=1 Tax=Kosakonia quasisacchari TaxID=2529380 RepID=A0A4R0GR88_9ENTR|nr:MULTISPECIES: tail fiber assembly protein [Enterobacteriaceae]AGN84913.1 hypothetical protein H650_06740 [Enterobacter sp. R4-368]TCB98141.1 tail fiber assembly protein [Kosakonia quasisacchari]
MDKFTIINALDKNLYYTIDFIVGISGNTLPEVWTLDRLGDGYYKAQYQGAKVDPETGEATGGKWVETGGPSRDDIIAAADWQKNSAISEATTRIAPLQDAVDIGIATDEEQSSLLLWKKYRVFLNRIDTTTAPDITWPVKPL